MTFERYKNTINYINNSMTSQTPNNQKNMSIAVKINNKITESFNPENVVAIVEENKSKLNNVNITTAIHRIAKLCHRKPYKINKIFPKLDSLISLINDKSSTFSGRQLANSTWGLSILQYRNLTFYKKMCEESRKKLNEFEPQHLAILAWSFASMNFFDEKLFEKMAMKAIVEISKFSPQNLSNLAWAFANLDYCNELLFKNIASQAIKTIREFAPQNISNLIWSFASLKMGETELVEKVVDESMKRLEEFNTQNLSNLAWSVATLTPNSKSNGILFEEISTVCLAKMEFFNARYLSNLLWGFVVVQRYPEQLLQKAIRYMNKTQEEEVKEMAAGYKSQWYQVDLALKLLLRDFSKKFGLCKEIRMIAALEFLKNESASNEDSVEVNNILNFLKVQFKCPYVLDEGLIVSNLIYTESSRVALNYLGPSNFLRSSGELKGETVLRQRLLKANGWKVATISYLELSNCGSFDMKIRLVASRLGECGVICGRMLPAAPTLRAKAASESVLFQNAENERRELSILDGIRCKTIVKRQMRIFLYDVETTKLLGGQFAAGFRFEMVEIDLVASTASYFVYITDREPLFAHPIKVR